MVDYPTTTPCLLCGKECPIQFSEEKGLWYYCNCEEETDTE